MSTTSAAPQIGRQLSAIAGVEHVCDDPALLTPFAIDGIRPTASVAPGSADEIAAVLRLANEQDLSVVTCGGFSCQALGRIPEHIDILLRTTRLNRVLHFDPGDLTVGVEAGMTVEQVHRTIGKSGLMLPLDVPRPAQATIGGTLSASSFGPLKHGFGGAREFCIGVTFVTGDGRIAKAGGRVVKNVAGYDLMKLFIGSQGSLGVITSGNFKLSTSPKQSRTFLAEFGTIDEAMSFRRSVQNSPLTFMCLELVSPLAQSYISRSPDDRWTVALRAGGSDSILARYRRDLGSSINAELTQEEDRAFWNALQEFDTTITAKHHNVLSIWVHLSASEIAKTMAVVQKIATDHNFLFACVGRAAIASLEVALIPIAVDPPSVMQYANAVSAIRGVLPRDSAAIVHRCPPEAKNHMDVWGSSTNDLEAMRAVKRALDPKGVLNRGRFLF